MTISGWRSSLAESAPDTVDECLPRLNQLIDHAPHDDQIFGELLTTPYSPTSPQLRAIVESVRDPSPVLVRAGPGSGKTDVLVRRYLLKILTGIPIRNILCTTFTCRAAREMKDRIHGRLTDFVDRDAADSSILSRQITTLENGDDWIGTFHSTCLRLLEHGPGEDRPALERLEGEFSEGISLVGWNDCLSMVQTITEDTQLGGDCDARAVMNQINDWRVNLVSAPEVSNRAETDFEVLCADIYRRLDRRKRDEGHLDFFDLIYHIGQLTRREPDFRQQLRNQFTRVMVDECQDTNPAQQLILRKLTEDRGGLFAVGDSRQAIYGWRGASTAMMDEFSRRYPHSSVIEMSRNFRSGTRTVFLANELIGGFGEDGAELEPTPDEQGGLTYRTPPGLFVANSAGEEVEFLAYYINKLVDEQDYEYGDIAIITRLNKQKQSLRKRLTEQSIPVRQLGSSSFFRRSTTESVFAALRSMKAFHDVTRGGKVVSFGDHWARWLTGDLGPLDESHRDFVEAFDSVQKLAELSEPIEDVDEPAPRHKQRLKRVLSTMRELVGRLHQGEYLPDRMDEFKSMFQVPNRRRVRRHFREAITWCRDHVECDGMAGLRQSLNRAALQAHDPQFTVDETNEKVKLSTIHGVKGMEFPVVFMPGLEDGWLPNTSPGSDDSANIAEERRLIFVGVTRAQDELVMSYARRRELNGELRDRSPSRFFDDIPDDYLDIRRGQKGWLSALKDFIRKFFSLF